LEASLVYLAIVVQDEDLVIHQEAPSHMNQDLCEEYVDADHSGGDAGFGEVAEERSSYAVAIGRGCRC